MLDMDDYSSDDSRSMIQPESNAGAVVGQVQTDMFCEGCGYSLHAQTIVKDPNLGVLVCRCPECGKYAAAGQTTTAARIWVSRLATSLLVIWVFALVGLFSMLSFFQGLMPSIHLYQSTTWQSTVLPNGNTIYCYALKPRPDSPDDDVHRKALGVQAAFALGFSFTAGSLFSLSFWHVRGLRRLLALLPAILGCAVAALIWIADPMAVVLRGWGAAWVSVFFIFESLATAAGVVLGRPLARAILGILVPPKPRQHLAFLWAIDGKKLPIEDVLSSPPAV